MKNPLEIYEPAEDSYLLSETLSKENLTKKKKFLDMGSGSGIQAETLINLGIAPKEITIVDINPEAIYLLKKKFHKSEIIKSDLFDNVKGKFDLIAFNPPYLPKDNSEPLDSRLATTGGIKGAELINKFLRQAENHLSKKGSIYLLTSSLTKGIKWKPYKKKLLSKKKIFMEELFVWELKTPTKS